MTKALASRQLFASRVTPLLLAILILGLMLRIWGIWFGLPFLFHNDEGFEVIRALQLGAGEFDFTRISKGGYFYLLFIEYGLLFVVFFLTGVVSSANEFAELYLKDPSAFYLVGRATTAIFGTITIYLVYRIGQVVYSTNAGLIAAALLAFNVLHSYLSHFVLVDVPMTCLATASLYFGVKISQGGSARDYWWAALFAALATTTKIPAALLIISLLIAHYYATRADNGGVLGVFVNRRLWQSTVIFLATYLVLTPGMFLYGGDMVWSVLDRFGIVASFGAEPSGDNELDFELDDRALFASTNLFVYYIGVLIDSMTLPVFVVCIAGLGFALWQRRPADVVLVSFAITTYAVISMSTNIHHFFPRYLLPAIPVLVVLGGRLIDSMLQRLAEPRRNATAAILLVLLAVWPVSNIVAANLEITQKDTRVEAREWVDANIPEGSKIFIEGHRTTLSNATVPLQNTAENIRDSIEYYSGREPGRVKYFQTLLKVQTGRTFDLHGVRAWDLKDLQHYKDIGVQYFVVRPRAYEGSRIRFHWEDLVNDIRTDPDIELIKSIEPRPGTKGGPYIEVYRVNSNVETGGVAD